MRGHVWISCFLAGLAACGGEPAGPRSEGHAKAFAADAIVSPLAATDVLAYPGNQRVRVYWNLHEPTSIAKVRVMRYHGQSGVTKMVAEGTPGSYYRPVSPQVYRPGDQHFRFIDEDLTAGDSYAYQVITMGDDGSEHVIDTPKVWPYRVAVDNDELEQVFTTKQRTDWCPDGNNIAFAGATPDLPVRAFRDAEDNVSLILPNHVSHRFVGKSFATEDLFNKDQRTLECDPMISSNQVADVSMFDDLRWLAAVHTPDGKNFFGLTYLEYHGADHGTCDLSKTNRLVCWYSAVSGVISYDKGATFDSIAPPPANLVATIPRQYSPTSTVWGAFAPSNLYQNPQDGRIYFIEPRNMTNLDVADTRALCLNRFDQETARFRFWNGTDFTGDYVNPYTNPQNPDEHVCADISSAHWPVNTNLTLSWNTFFNKHMLTGTSAEMTAHGLKYGVYMSLSDDLIHWEPRELLYEFPLGTGVRYDSHIDHNSPGRNFDRSDDQFHLYLASWLGAGINLEVKLDRIPVKLLKR